MKKIFTVAFTFCMLAGAAQPNLIPFFKKIPIKNLEGRDFKLMANVRTEIEDDSASASLYFQVEDINRRGLRKVIQPIRSSTWKTYTFEGKVTNGAILFQICLMCQYSGNFYLDDVRVLIKDTSGNWQTYYKTGFEENLDGWEKAKMINPEKDTMKYFTVSLSENNPFEGRKCALIRGENIPIYGINNRIGKFAEINGIRLYYEIFGKGHPLLVLHGNGGSIKDASEFYPQLSKKYQVIAIDSRGQGRSTDNDEELTYDLMASDINALLGKLNLDSVYIWGHSDGAIVGLILAMRYPERVSKLLACGANVSPDSTAVSSWVFKKDILNVSTKKTTKAKRLTKLLRDYPNIPFDSLTKIKAPVLLMIGDRDIIRPEHELKMFQFIPNSQLCIIPGATHTAAWEKDKIFMIFLSNFFDEPFVKPDSKDNYW